MTGNQRPGFRDGLAERDCRGLNLVGTSNTPWHSGPHAEACFRAGFISRVCSQHRQILITGTSGYDRPAPCTALVDIWHHLQRRVLASHTGHCRLSTLASARLWPGDHATAGDEAPAARHSQASIQVLTLASNSI